MSLCYICAPKVKITSCMLPEIWSATDIFCHFGSFFALLPYQPPWILKFGKSVKNTWRYYPFTHVCHKPRSNDGWLLRYKVRRTEFFVILGHFLLFHPPNNSKNPNFEKMKETPGVITLLQMCIINEDRMMYGSWDIRRDGLSFLSFWVIFCTLIHLTIRKNSNFEKKA